MTYNFN